MLGAELRGWIPRAVDLIIAKLIRVPLESRVPSTHRLACRLRVLVFMHPCAWAPVPAIAGLWAGGEAGRSDADLCGLEG